MFQTLDNYTSSGFQTKYRLTEETLCKTTRVTILSTRLKDSIDTVLTKVPRLETQVNIDIYKKIHNFCIWFWQWENMFIFQKKNS